MNPERGEELDISSSQEFVRSLEGLSVILTILLVLGFIISLILSISARDDYDKAAAKDRPDKFLALRFARKGRMIMLIGLSVTLLLVATCQSVIMQDQLHAITSRQGRLLGQVDTYALQDGSTINVPSDPNGTVSRLQAELNDSISSLPWLIVAWMAFAVVVALLVVQLWAKPWKYYEETPDGTLDLVYAAKRKLEADLESSQKQNRKLAKQRAREEKEHFKTLRDYSRTLDANDDLIAENLTLVETLTRVEHDRSRLEDEVDRLTVEEE